jgi:4'-phosphopantetheinyl transferase EntD
VSSESNARLDSAIYADLFEAEIRVAASPLRDCVEDLTASERELVRGVVHKRELEFATGRMLAKQVLTELSHPKFELLRDQDRVPI